MNKKVSASHEVKKNKALFLMILPVVLYFLLFSYLPMSGIVLAFKQLRYDKGIFDSPWVGLANFRFFFLSGNAMRVTVNTLLYNIAFIITGLILQLTVAIIFSELAGNYYKKLLQSLMFFPYFVSWVVVGTFIYNLFNYEFGSFNTFISSLGMERIDFYGNAPLWKYIIVFFNNWKYLGYSSIIYIAAITNIDINLYEAAEIDGANIFQRIRMITLPMLVPLIITMVLINVGYIFRGNFDLFYQIIGGNSPLYDSTDVIDTFVFRSLLQSQEVGMAAAAGFYQSILCFAIIMATNFLVKKINPENSLF